MSGDAGRVIIPLTPTAVCVGLQAAVCSRSLRDSGLLVSIHPGQLLLSVLLLSANCCLVPLGVELLSQHSIIFSRKAFIFLLQLCCFGFFGCADAS